MFISTQSYENFMRIDIKLKREINIHLWVAAVSNNKKKKHKRKSSLSDGSSICDVTEKLRENEECFQMSYCFGLIHTGSTQKNFNTGRADRTTIPLRGVSMAGERKLNCTFEGWC